MSRADGRTEKLQLRLNQHERAALRRLAKAARVTQSEMVRRIILAAAERLGVATDDDDDDFHGTNAVRAAPD